MPKRVLIVEDDPGASRFFSFSLESEGFEVTTAMNGLEGLKKAQSELPDLLVLDIMLPGLDGFEVCHRLRSDPETARIPIVMTSAKGQEVDREMALKVGANRFLNKPVKFEDLVSTVKDLTGQTA